MKPHTDKYIHSRNKGQNMKRIDGIAASSVRQD